jgi:hypothetical protein
MLGASGAMGSKQDKIAAEVDAAHKELMELITNATPEQWRMTAVNHPEINFGEDEHRGVGVLAHHLATAHSTTILRCRSWIAGTPVPAPTAEDNAAHEAANPAPDRATTIRMLEANVGELKAYIRSLSDQDLEATGPFVRGEITVEQLLGRNTPYHVRWHAGSIKATWEKAASRG